jgi:prepilin-type processing-associated H-X9-DG protein
MWLVIESAYVFTCVIGGIGAAGDLIEREGYAVREKKGFSILELLVIIGVVAVVASVLVPVCAEDKGTVDQVKCMSNLNELGKALAMYAQDYNGVTVPAEYKVPGRKYSGGKGAWWELLMPYIKSAPVANVVRGTDTNRGAGYKVKLSPALECPADPSPYWGISYGMPYAFAPTYYGEDKNRPAPVAVKNIAVPARCIVLADSKAGLIVPTPSCWSTSSVDARHNGQTNCLFADGHTGQMSFPADQKELTKSGKHLYFQPYSPESEYKSYKL